MLYEYVTLTTTGIMILSCMIVNHNRIYYIYIYFAYTYDTVVSVYTIYRNISMIQSQHKTIAKTNHAYLLITITNVHYIYIWTYRVYNVYTYITFYAYTK